MKPETTRRTGAKLPQAPDLARLRRTAPSLRTVDSTVHLHRVYRRGGDYATLWNTFREAGPLPASRFDHQPRPEAGGLTAQPRGILYAAMHIHTAVAEFFRGTRQINRTRQQPWLASFVLPAELHLLDLTDAFGSRVGASAKLVSGPPAHAQNWSRGFYEAYEEVHGLYYLSSLTNRPAVALYERANQPSLFPANPVFHRALADPTLHKALVLVGEEIGYGLV